VIGVDGDDAEALSGRAAAIDRLIDDQARKRRGT